MEEEVGIRGYLTTTPGIGGRIKARPEDFVVEEVPRDLPVVEDGRFLVVRVRARNWETNRLVRQIARSLGISRRRISFAGTKDKRAVTSRLMTMEGVDATDLERVRIRDVEIAPLHRTDRGIELGHLLGNSFEVRITDIRLKQGEVRRRLESLAAELKAAGGFPNFFGPQRFGEVRPISHLVGRCLVRGDLKGAVEMYLAHPYPGEEEDSFLARKAFEESWDVARALREYPERLSFERAILNHLRHHPEDYRGALEQLPGNLLTLFIYAYQAYLFNRILSFRLEEGMPLNEPMVGDLVIPMDRMGLPRRDSPVEVTESNLEKVRRQVKAGKAWVSGLLLGYDVPFAKGEMGRLERQVVEEEGVRPEDFVVSEMSRLSSRGLRRELLAPLMDLSYRVDSDVLLSFRLNPGCYATALLREIMKGGSPY
jgi:tRNA pseudouridine13 synthase